MNKLQYDALWYLVLSAVYLIVRIGSTGGRRKLWNFMFATSMIAAVVYRVADAIELRLKRFE